jgi:hypothetical protein
MNVRQSLEKETGPDRLVDAIGEEKLFNPIEKGL